MPRWKPCRLELSSSGIRLLQGRTPTEFPRAELLPLAQLERRKDKWVLQLPGLFLLGSTDELMMVHSREKIALHLEKEELKTERL